jgi:hypothetical protein
MIYDRFHVLGVFPRSELPVRAGTVANDSLDVRHFFLAAEFLDLARNEVEEFV